MQADDALYGTVKNGLIVLSGDQANITLKHGSLCIRDGIKGNIVENIYGRARCPVSRIISTQWSGYVSFDAIRWMHGVGASFVHLGYDGTPLVASIPRHSVPASLRRKQALLSPTSEPGSAIASALLHAKLQGQIRVLEHFGFHNHAAEARVFAERLATRFELITALGFEANVATKYFDALADTPLSFGKRQNVPAYWRTLGNRQSPLSSSGRKAVTPGQAMLNYLYGVLASEITIALHAYGVDPALGIFHTDKDDRASLTYDLIEPARPVLDRWFLRWLKSTTFSKRDFVEGVVGEVHITRPLSSHLAMTAGLWRGIAEQVASWFYQCLATEKIGELRLPASVETDAKRRAVRWSLRSALERPIPTTCAECGKALSEKRRKFCSQECMRSYYGGAPVEAGLAAIKRARAIKAAKGLPMRGPSTFKAKAMSLAAWRRQPGWSPAFDSTMLRWFREVLQPLLADARPAAIRDVTGLSGDYSFNLYKGRYIPHPRHYRLLAEVAGVEFPFKIGDEAL